MDRVGFFVQRQLECAYRACAWLGRLPLSAVQGLFDLVNKILNEAGAANAHDVYINLYPASNGRLRPHDDRKQVKFDLASMVVVALQSVLYCCMLQSSTFKVNIRFSNVASELLIWVSQDVSREP